MSLLPDQVFSSADLENEILSLLFHPTEQMLLAGDLHGCIHFNLFDLDDRSVSLPEGMDLKPFTPHKGQSCRAIDIASTAATYIVSGGSDCSIAVSSFDPKVITRYRTDTAINVVRCLNEEGTIILAGDDEGGLTGIDIRQKKKIFSIQEQEDYITSITSMTPNGLKSVVCTSGDCTLAVYDLRGLPDSEGKKRKDRLVAMSDPQENELNCAIVMNAGQHLLTGDANGVVAIWRDGYWGDLKDRVPLYQKSENPKGGMDGAHSIEGMKRIEDKEYLAVTSDGIIRTLSLFPNHVQRVIGVHKNNDDTEVATISAFDCDAQLGLVATAAGDSEGRIKFWSQKSKQTESEAPEEIEPKRTERKKKNKKNSGGDIHSNFNRASKQEFFSDL